MLDNKLKSATVLSVENTWAIVVAAGSGTRFGSAKQYANLGGKSVLSRSIATARKSCNGVVLVVRDIADGSKFGADLLVQGGATRTESVRRGLAALPIDADIVVIHDAARPGAPHELFDSVINEVIGGADGSVPGLAIADTVKRVRNQDRGMIVESTVNRVNLVTVQTPQAFGRRIFEAAYLAYDESNSDFSDDAGLVENIGGIVKVIEGDKRAHKITTKEDLIYVAQMMGFES